MRSLRLSILHILRCEFEELFREPESKSKIVFGDRARADE